MFFYAFLLKCLYCFVVERLVLYCIYIFIREYGMGYWDGMCYVYNEYIGIEKTRMIKEITVIRIMNGLKANTNKNSYNYCIDVLSIICAELL